VEAPAEFFFTDSMPFRALALVSYASPVAMTWPLLALSLNRNLPDLSLYSSNLPAVTIRLSH